MNAIDARNLALTYADGTEAVGDVSLAIPEGEFFGFLGANGAGKTTTIKMLVTLLRPTRGEVTVDGYDAESEPRRVRESTTMIGVNVLQFPLLFLSGAFLPLDVLPGGVRAVATVNPITYGVDAARALMFGRDVMTVVDVTAFGGGWNTLVPAVGVLVALDFVLGSVAVYYVARATSAEAR